VIRRALAALAVLALLAACGGDDGGVDAARDLAADADGWDSGDEAAATLARVTELLLDGARGCDGDDRAGGAACAARSAAAGYTEVLALLVLRCTAPDRFEARTELVRYLDDVLAMGADDLPPSPPPPPACRR
jgi:hypothetical protein